MKYQTNFPNLALSAERKKPRPLKSPLGARMVHQMIKSRIIFGLILVVALSTGLFGSAFASDAAKSHYAEPAAASRLYNELGFYAYLPGFGGMTKQEIGNIHPSFVSSVYAGIVSGLTAGLIVGVVIFLIQKWSEARQLRRTLDREVSIFKEETRHHLECVDSFPLRDAEVIPTSAQSLNDALKERPVDLWLEHLPERRAFIEKLKRFQTSIFEFRSSANKFDNWLCMLIRKHNSSRDSISANDPPMYVYCLGRLRGLSDVEIAPVMEFGVKDGKVYNWVKACYDEVTKDSEMEILSKDYMAGKKALEAMLEELREELGMVSA